MAKLKSIWKVLKHRPMSLLGFGLIGFFLAVAALEPVLAPPAAGSRASYLIPHSGRSPHPLRTLE